MEADEDTVEGDDKLLEQVPAYKPGWEVVFHFGDEELLTEGTACDGYGEIMQLEDGVVRTAAVSRKCHNLGCRPSIPEEKLHE